MKARAVLGVAATSANLPSLSLGDKAKSSLCDRASAIFKIINQCQRLCMLAVEAIIVTSILCLASAQSLSAAQSNSLLIGKAAFGNWKSDAPGIRRHIRISDLPMPYASHSAAHIARIVKRPVGTQLHVPPGFRVKLLASGLDQPRLIRVAPNGDVFVAESKAGRIRVLRLSSDQNEVRQNEIFAYGLRRPFGIAFYPNGNDPQWLYVANTDSVVRFHYRNGDLRANERPEVVVPSLPHGGNHWTRDIAFSFDNTKMFISVGSASNDARQRIKGHGHSSIDETGRADVLAFNPNGEGRRVYASGIRNCASMAVNTMSGDLWCSTNERDGLGDNLPPDYITRVRDGGFYGWPWYYIGTHEDPRHKGARPDLKNKVIVPDILIQPHSAPLQMMFYTGNQFPQRYNGNVFAALHGSWNRNGLTGYKIVRCIVKDDVPSGVYEDFVTGFVLDDSRVWGRPVGIAQAKDGALLFSDDGNGTIWRVSYLGHASR